MTINKVWVDRILTVIAAAAAPALTLCVDSGGLSATVASDIGVLVAAALTAYHGGAAVANRATPTPVAAAPVTVPPAATIALKNPPENPSSPAATSVVSG